MTTYCLTGFQEKHLNKQRPKDMVGIIVDADDPKAAVKTATEILGSGVRLMAGQEIDKAPVKRKGKLLAKSQLTPFISDDDSFNPTADLKESFAIG